MTREVNGSVPASLRRLFFALSLPTPIGEALLKSAPLALGVRPVESSEDLHLTLKFIGNTTIPVSRLMELARPAIAAHLFRFGPPPRLIARGVNVFPYSDGRECRIFWGDLSSDEEGSGARRWLALLAGAIDGAVGAEGGKATEAFVPHLTLARRGSRSVPLEAGLRWIEEWKGVEFGEWQPEAVLLYETLPPGEAAGTGARFRKVGVLPFEAVDLH